MGGPLLRHQRMDPPHIVVTVSRQFARTQTDSAVGVFYSDKVETEAESRILDIFRNNIVM